MLKDNRKILNL